MTLIKHLSQQVVNSTYDEAIAIGREHETANGGCPKNETISRALRKLVERGILRTVRRRNVIIGYNKII